MPLLTATLIGGTYKLVKYIAFGNTVIDVANEAQQRIEHLPAKQNTTTVETTPESLAVIFSKTAGSQLLSTAASVSTLYGLVSISLDKVGITGRVQLLLPTSLGSATLSGDTLLANVANVVAEYIDMVAFIIRAVNTLESERGFDGFKVNYIVTGRVTIAGEIGGIDVAKAKVTLTSTNQGQYMAVHLRVQLYYIGNGTEGFLF